MTKQTITLTLDDDDEMLLRAMRPALSKDTGARYQDHDVYMLALRHMAYGADPVYMRERLGVELELCPNECDDGTVAGRGKARTPCPRCRGYGDIFVRMKARRLKGGAK